MSAHEKLVSAVSLVLRDRRELLSFSQSDLARKSGLHRSYIGDFERGFRNISLRNLSRLSAALNLTPSKLLLLAEKKAASEQASRTVKTVKSAKATTKSKTKTTAKASKTAVTKKSPAKAVKKVSRSRAK